jgi:hypothetical protein
MAQRDSPHPSPRPYGGSRWARFFAGPTSVPIRARGLATCHNVTCHPDGSITSTAAGTATGVVLRAGPGVPLGDFLTQELPGIFGYFASAPQAAQLIGPAPTAPQNTVLGRLGLPASAPLTGPEAFAALLTSAPASPHAAPADPECLAMLAKLRAPATACVPAAVGILPAVEAPIALHNRVTVAAWLRAHRVQILTPDTANFDATAAACAAATLAILADTHQSGLLGLLPPGTRVLEICPEGCATGQVRALCAALGLPWSLFLATPPRYPVLEPLPFAAQALLSYEIPIASLRTALAAL